MSARSRVLVAGAISCGFVLIGLALAPTGPWPDPTARSGPPGDRETQLAETPPGELELAHGLGRAEAAVPASEGRPGGTWLEVRNLTPEVGEIEIVLTRGGIEWGRGLARGGALRFQDLEPGSYLLRTVVGGGWLPDIPLDEESRDDDGLCRRVLVPRGGATLELRFLRPARLAGIVSDPRGAPLAGTPVLVQDLLRPDPTWTLRTDEAGAFAAERMTPSRYGITLAVPDLGGLVAVPLSETLQPGRATWIDLRLSEGRRSLRGRVADSEETGVEGLRLVCVLPEHAVGRDGGVRALASRVVASGHTDADGYFHFERLPDVPLQIGVDARELDLRANGRPPRLLRAFEPVQVGAGAGETVVGTLTVER